MQSRLSAFVKLFFSGKCWINTQTTVSSRSIFAVSDRHHGKIDCSFKARGFERLSRALHSAALEDDAFSELGLEESECSTLVTEEPDNFVEDGDAFSELDSGILKCSDKKFKLDTEKHNDILDNDVFLELGPGISECSAKKTKLVIKKPKNSLDDAVLELGPGISECSSKKIKLVTEKRDGVSKTKSHRRESASKPISSDYRPNAKDLFEAIARASTILSTKSNPPAHSPNGNKSFRGMAQPSTSSSTKLHSSSSTDHKEMARSPLSSELNADDISGATTKASAGSLSKLPSRVHAPTSTDDTKNVSEVEYPLSVSIKNIPPKVGLSELIEAISVFGKVSGASFVTKSDKSQCCNIEFEDAESSRRAILAGKVVVGSNVFIVNSLGDVDLVIVRINNINEKTADSAIHSECKSVGELVGLTRASKNDVDAFFNVRDDKSRSHIVRKLNKKVLDLNQWSAHAIKSTPNSSEVPSDKGANLNLQRQILNQFNELKRVLQVKEMNLQDLEYLTTSIIHIQDVPPYP